MTMDFTHGQVYIRQHAGKIPWMPIGSRSGTRSEELASSSPSTPGESVGEADYPSCETVHTIMVLCHLYLSYNTVSNLIAPFGHTGPPSTYQQTSISTMLIPLLTYVYCRPHFRKLPRGCREVRGSLGPSGGSWDRRWLRSSPSSFPEPVEYAI